MLRSRPPAPPWPDGKTFAFTVFDDPDGKTRDARLHVYPMLEDLGFRTTKAVWPIGPLRERNSPGETCADLEYREDAQRIQERGFEIGYHCAAPHSSTREEMIESLDRFREYFGNDPSAMANHYNADAIYWGPARMSGSLQRAAYNVMTRGQNRTTFCGHVEGSPHFWGDICRERIRYCRNLVYRDINTLRVCPLMPYHNPDRPYVQAWFSSAEGAICSSFLETISEANQDRLEAEGGLCIMYTHFGKGFVEDGKLNSEFVRLMKRLSRKNGWFAPVSPMLDYLRQQRGDTAITPSELGQMEWKWLYQKSFHGTS